MVNNLNNLGKVTFKGNEYNIVLFTADSVLSGSNIVSIDTETDLIQSRAHTPDMITFQAFDGSNDTVYIVEPSNVKLFFSSLHRSVKLVMHNAAFDMDVIAPYIGKDAVFRLYDENRILDTSILFRLLHLGTVGHLNTKYSLDYCLKRLMNIELPKDESIRLHFGDYKGQPIANIPAKFIEYAALDAIATFFLYLRLMPEIKAIDKYGTLLSHDIQVKGDLALSHITKNGIGFDLARKEEWLVEQDKTLYTLQERLSNWGWMRGVKGVNQRFEDILKHLDIYDKLPRTETGSISSKGEDLGKFRHFSFIDDYLSFNELEKTTSFVREVETNRVHPRYNLIVNTGRTSCSKPNFQQLPRAGDIRSMFLAGKGKKLIVTDYNAIELSTLAQTTYDMFGYSEMKEQINDGIDLHRYYASVMHNVPITDVSKDQRQEAKAANFGFPGGLGIGTFIEFSRGYGLSLSESVAQEMKNTWFSAFPEMKGYMKNEQGMVYTRTGRLRANTTYCAEKNTPFQGLAADGAKLALYNMDKAGFKIVGFVHDEIITEVDVLQESSLLEIQESIMVESMRQVCPDVAVGVESNIVDVYTK